MLLFVTCTFYCLSMHLFDLKHKYLNLACVMCVFLTCLWTLRAARVAFFRSAELQSEKLTQQLAGIPLTGKYTLLSQLV